MWLRREKNFNPSKFQVMQITKSKQLLVMEHPRLDSRIPFIANHNLGFLKKNIKPPTER